jgi:hypothetical protein
MSTRYPIAWLLAPTRWCGGDTLPQVSVTADGKKSVRYDVEYRSGLRGSTIYLPRSPAPKPALLLLHGSEGGFAGWSHVWALALAQAGFVTLPWRYSKGGSPWCAGDILEVPLHETERGSGVVANRTWCLGPPWPLWGILRRRAWSPPDGIDGARQSGPSARACCP